MNVSIIMPTYKRDDILEKTLEGYRDLDDSGISWALTVVDNACSEPTRALVEKYAESKPITYLSESKEGKNNALNTALPYAVGELIIFTDDDAIPDSNWLKNIVEGSQRWPDHHLFGGKILPKFPENAVVDDRIPLDHDLVKAAYVIADWDQAEGPIGYGKIWGPNMVVRKSVLEAGLKFNPNIGPSQNKNYIMGDEMEFLRKAHSMDFQSAYLPDAIVHHQIRPDQLSMKWLTERVYRDGRSRAFSSALDKRAKRWFGVPRYHYRNAIQNLLLSAFYWLTGKRQKRFEHTMAYHMALGSISMHRELKKRNFNHGKSSSPAHTDA